MKIANNNRVKATKRGFAAIMRGFLYILPVVLFFSYYPVISLGFSETMNLELSLPMLWLVLFDVFFAIVVFALKWWRKVWGDIRDGWKWLVLPVFITMTVLWSLNVMRGVLTCGVMWLVVVAVYGIFRMWEDFYDDWGSRYDFLRVFMISTMVICGWCVLQCVMDVLGVGREYTLMCAGCGSRMFGFPHPNGFAIEPQFMGNLLLAPAAVTAWLVMKKQDIINPERERSRGCIFHDRSGGLVRKLQFPHSSVTVVKNTSGSRSLCSGFIISCFFVITATLFLTFSRGAIYAFVVGMMFMTGYVVVKWGREMWKKVGVMWGLVVLAFVVVLNVQGVLTQIGPTRDTYGDGVAKVVNHLTLGIVDFRGGAVENLEEGNGEEAVFDGYVEESTNIRTELTQDAFAVWRGDAKTMLVGVGIGGAGQAMYDAGLTGSPKEIVQNEYASLLAETGAIGLLLFMIFVAMVVRAFMKGWCGGMCLALLAMYGITLVFFSGLANALQIYLMPAVLYMVLRKKLVS